MKLSKTLIILLDILALLLLIGLDQFTKDLAVRYLKNQPAVPIWQGVLELNYLENKGAAFGMLKNQKWFFIFIAIVILGIICYILWKTPNQKKYITLHALLTLIAAGAIGNMIDRIRFDYVVDFIYFKLIHFPIFNVADIYVTCCTIAIVILLLFVYKEEDLDFINFKKKSFKELK